MLQTLKQVKKIVVVIIGFTILLIGIVLFFLPGPSSIVIPIGLSILATEFLWAKRLLHKFKYRVNKTKEFVLTKIQNGYYTNN